MKYNHGITLDQVLVSPKDFLKTFFEETENIRMRRFSDKKKNDKAYNYTFTFDKFSSVFMDMKKYNEMGCCISFIPNGHGHNDKDVIASGVCKAHFIDIDDYPIELQIKLVNAFPLKPSIVIKTKKSLHVYWLINDGDINLFREIQEMLIAYWGSDDSICNESRAMRFPGFYHNKEEPVMVEVIQYEPSLKYTQDQIRNAIKEKPIEELMEDAELTDSEKELVRAAIKSNTKSSSKIQTEIAPGEVGEGVIPEGQRVSTLISFIATFKNKGIVDEAIISSIREINARQCHPPLSDEELEREVFKTISRWDSKGFSKKDIIEKLKILKPQDNESIAYNDKGNGALFSIIFKPLLRWNVSAKEWFYYNGKVWKEDTGGMMASRCAKKLADALIIYSTNIADEDKRKRYIDHYSKLGKYRFRMTMLDDARDGMFVSQEDFDRDDYLLNLQNGVLDLRNFVLNPHDPDLLLSKICNAEFKEDATSERWLKFLDEVMQGNKLKIKYLQVILGYALTGDTKEEKCFLLYGKTTRNGKSTLVETISYMLGESEGYALSMRPETLAVKKNNDSRQANSDIARLKGCRFLNASEPPKRMLLDDSQLKVLTGRDQVTARNLYQKDFQFFPSFKLFINTNYLPLIRDNKLFESERINVITFDKHFEEWEQDKTLKDKLKQPDSLSGILNWCLDGLKMYQEEGIKPPEEIRVANNEYKFSSDKIANFIRECLEEDVNVNCAASEVFVRYKEWCKENEYGIENKKNFYSELRDKGMLYPSATVNGRTVANALVGYRVLRNNNVPGNNFFSENEPYFMATNEESPF